jgi:hypothetical protein
MKHYKCLIDYENALHAAADELISAARGYKNPPPFRALIEDICDRHDIGPGSIYLLAELIREREPDIDVEIIDDEITLFCGNQQSVTQPPPPFSHARTNEMLDAVLDWIAENESGADLYDTLKNTIGMSDEEISAAGFGTLEKYFENPDEDESTGMTLQ